MTSGLRDHLREELLGQARTGLPVTYKELADRLALAPPRTVHRVTEALEQLMDEDAAAGRPLLAALAVSRARPGLPARGFFLKARALGLFSGDPEGREALEFHARELRRALRVNSALKKSASAARLWLAADDEHRGFGTGGEGEDGERGTAGGREDEQVRRDAGHELSRGAGTDQEARDQAEVVAGDVHEVALLQVLPPAQPGPAHPAAVEGQREAPLDQLGPELERLPGHPGAEPGPVVVDRPTGRLVAAPAVDAGALLLRDPALPGAVLQLPQPVARVVPLVGHQLGR